MPNVLLAPPYSTPYLWPGDYKPQEHHPCGPFLQSMHGVDRCCCDFDEPLLLGRRGLPGEVGLVLQNRWWTKRPGNGGTHGAWATRSPNVARPLPSDRYVVPELQILANGRIVPERTLLEQMEVHS